MKLKTAIRKAITDLEGQHPWHFNFMIPIYYNFEVNEYELGGYVDRSSWENKPNLLEVCRVPAWNEDYSESRKKKEKAQMVKQFSHKAEQRLIEYKAVTSHV